MIVLLAGLPGVGKSTLAAPLGRAIDAVVVDRDDIKASVIPRRYLTHSSAQVALATKVSAQLCETVLSENPEARLIVDGHTFSRGADIDRYRRITNAAAMRLVIVHCIAPESVVAARIASDADGVAKDRTWAKYVHVRDRFEPLEGDVLTVSLTSTTQTAVEYVVANLFTGD